MLKIHDVRGRTNCAGKDGKDDHSMQYLSPCLCKKLMTAKCTLPELPDSTGECSSPSELFPSDEMGSLHFPDAFVINPSVRIYQRCPYEGKKWKNEEE